MTKEINFLQEHLKMEVMRLKELGFGEAHCEAAIRWVRVSRTRLSNSRFTLRVRR